MDGRTFCVRSGAAIATVITVAGLELATAGAAHAAPSPRRDYVDSAGALAERLAGQAEQAGTRRDRMQTALTRAEKKLDLLKANVRQERRTSHSLRSEVADLAGEEQVYDGTSGTAAPEPAPTGDSAALLTNVVVVSEDTYGLAQSMSASGSTLESLSARRVAATSQVTTLRARAQKLAAIEERLQKRADAAEARVTDLMGGPAVQYAMSKVGYSYVYGAAGPSAFDCSGLTMAAWAQAGVSLPHSSSAQYSSGRHISESELQPGDLVFYYSPISHVGMYIGDGKIVNALNPGAGVVVSGLHDMPYVGAVRPG